MLYVFLLLMLICNLVRVEVLIEIYFSFIPEFSYQKYSMSY